MNKARQRKIIHCDCDCFFAAIEMRDNPALRGVPLAVGGDPGKRGVVATCNYEARRFGVRSAMASATAKKLCPQLVIVRGNMDLYREASARIHEILQDYTDLIEPLSLDEAYLDVTDSQACQGSATLIAEQIRARVKDSVGITISAGVAPNKFLAKIASDWDKPDGLTVILPDAVDQFVRSLAVEKLYGVGPATADKLHRRGIRTCEDLRAFDLVSLVELMGSFGERLHQLCRGRDDRPLRVSRRRKSLSVEHTFDVDLPDLDACLEQLPRLEAMLEERMGRLDDSYQVAGALVKLKFDDFMQTTVEQSTATPERYTYRALMIEGFSRGARPVRLLGVGVRLSDAQSDPVSLQLSLFND